jgi:hypothetical protein
MRFDDENDEINIEVGDVEGTLFTKGPILSRSGQSLDEVMGLIEVMSRRVVNTIKAMPMSDVPDLIEVEFGVKITPESRAIVSQSVNETQIRVRLEWHNEGLSAD